MVMSGGETIMKLKLSWYTWKNQNTKILKYYLNAESSTTVVAEN